jgi:DNA-binding NtrC family response regulator
LRVPALREHREDIALLARSFVEGLSRLNGLPPIAFEPATVEALERHPWPGNVKELRDAVETAVILAADGVVRVRDLPEPLRGTVGGTGARCPGRPALPRRQARRGGCLRTRVPHGPPRPSPGERHRGRRALRHARSALQRLLRKHDLRSVDFRRPGGQKPTMRSEAWRLVVDG